MRRKVFGPQISGREISAANKRQTEEDEKDNQNETAFGKTTEAALCRRRFDPRRTSIHRFLSFSIFVCVSISLSYNARNPSEMVFVPASTGMKFVSPFQRGTMWICK